MSRKTLKWISLIAAGAIVLAAVFIMLRGLGLAPDYDFGAGAYYYADIPDFEKHVGEGAYQSGLPLWAAILIFLGWCVLMYLLWIWIDRRK